MKQSTNPSAIRSRKMLTSSLLILMYQKPYQEISIKDIAERADVNRRTFYRNFESKDDILFYYGKLLVGQLGRSIQAKGVFSFHSICESYFEFWALNLDFLKLLKKNNLLYFLFEQFDQYHDQLHLFLPKVEHKESAEFSIAFALGGFWSALVQWLNTGAEQSPSYMADLICNTLKNPFTE